MSPPLRMGFWSLDDSFPPLSLLCLFFPRLVAGQQDINSETNRRNDFAVQIAGIVSSYLIFDALIVLLILLVGRRLRRAAQTSNYTLDVVMLQPLTAKGVANSTTDPSPVSGVTGSSPDTEKARGGGWRSMSWSSLGKGSSSRGGPASPNSSVATIDESVIEADRRRAQEDLEKLYAAVMDHEAQKEAAAVAGLSPSSVSSVSPVSPGSPPPMPMPQSPKGSLPGFQRTPLSPLQEVATPPPSGNSLKARANQRLSKLSSGLAIFSPSLSSSAKSSPKTPRHPRTPSVRNLPISPPVQVVTGAAAANLVEPLRSPPAFNSDPQPPLTPRTYNPGPPPAPPVPEVNHEKNPNTNPSTNTTEHKQTKKPAPLALKTTTTTTTTTANTTTTAANPSGTLPFRQQFSSTASGMPQSAPPTKTTVLERPAHLHGSGPRTGVPTPYSPYMPFTPVTPITPSKMVTKKEKRKKDREDALRVLHEDDMVKSDEELWGL
ncbi:hypothetical protein VTN31DRAFT_1963 [Thermomyces dupontii]|uniref:uncharacterized protein n=1 Tax=Talaromyces thermophilus TaxID=28565 RepID=UPI003742D1D2